MRHHRLIYRCQSVGTTDPRPRELIGQAIAVAVEQAWVRLAAEHRDGPVEVLVLLGISDAIAIGIGLAGIEPATGFAGLALIARGTAWRRATLCERILGGTDARIGQLDAIAQAIAIAVGLVRIGPGGDLVPVFGAIAIAVGVVRIGAAQTLDVIGQSVVIGIGPSSAEVRPIEPIATTRGSSQSR